MAKQVSLALDQGATFSYVIPLVDANGAPSNTANLSANAEFRRYYNSTNAITFTCNLANSSLTLSLSAAQTANVLAGRYVYDVYITDSGANTVTRYQEGILTVTPSVTH